MQIGPSAARWYKALSNPQTGLTNHDSSPEGWFNLHQNLTLHQTPHPTPPPPVGKNCEMSEVCVKAPSPLPPLIVSGPGEYPLSSHSSNYPSVSPWRQMLREPSPIRHSAAAWQTQYEKKANCHTLHCHINSPPSQFLFSSCSPAHCRCRLH